MMMMIIIIIMIAIATDSGRTTGHALHLQPTPALSAPITRSQKMVANLLCLREAGQQAEEV